MTTFTGSSVVFKDGVTFVPATWLNDVNNAVYNGTLNGAIRTYRGVVANQAAMLALPVVNVGDWVERADLSNQIWELTSGGQTILANWTPYPGTASGSAVPTVRSVSASTDTLLATDAGNIVQYSANCTVTVPTVLYGVAPVTIEALSGVTITWAAGTGVTTLNTPASTMTGYSSAVILPGGTTNTFNIQGAGGPDVRNGGGFYASTVANGVWILTYEAPWSGYFTKTTTGCKSGTCTINVNIGATSYVLGSGGSVTGGTNLGAANSVTSTKTDVAQTTGNTFTTGQLVTVIVSANASCLEAYLQLTAVRTGP